MYRYLAVKPVYYNKGPITFKIDSGVFRVFAFI